MNWSSVFATISAVIISVGGAGAIIVAVSHFFANRIAERLELKYQLKLGKELEQFKAVLDQRIYITKTQFDVEFDIYRELSKSIFDFLVTLNTTIATGDYPKQQATLSDEKIHAESSVYRNMVERSARTQELLYKNAAFMPEHIYEQYLELIELITDQFWTYNTRFHKYVEGEIFQSERVIDSDKEQYDMMSSKFDMLNKNIREYLGTLYIVE